MSKVAITTVNPKQQDLADLFADRWEGHPLEVIGKGNHRITVLEPVSGRKHDYTYTQFESLLERLPHNVMPAEEWSVPPEEAVTTDAEVPAEIDEQALAQPQPPSVAAPVWIPAEEPLPVIELGTGPIADAREEVQRATADLLDAIRQEHSSELGKNASRLIKGRTLTILERAAEKLKKFNASEIQGMTPLQFARSWVESRMEDAGIFDTRLDDSEVYMTRKVYRALEPLGGVNMKFTDMYAINPKTNQPLVRDDGEPYERSVTEVAMNKLWYVSDLLQQNSEGMVSFAHRMTEKGLKEFKRLKPDTMPPSQVNKVVKEIMTGTMPSPEDPEQSVPWDEKRIKQYVNEKLGIKEDEGSGVRSMQFPEEWYDTEYREIREMATSIMGFLGLTSLIEEKTGLIKHVHIFGPILRHYFNINEFGPWRLLEMYVQSGVISVKQAGYFKIAWEDEGLRDLWEQQHGTEANVNFDEVYPDDDSIILSAVAVEEDEGEGELPF